MSKNNYKGIDFPTLPKVFKRKWLKALRSGEHKQGQNELWDGEDSYCCLGVASRVSGYSDKRIHERCYIPKNFKALPEELLGVSDLSGLLSTMNDGSGNRRSYKKEFTFNKKRSFNQIANFIEKYL